MNIELRIKNFTATLEDIDFEKQIEQFDNNRNKLSEQVVDFISIHSLQGNKEILQMAYENQKIESSII